MKNLIRGVFSLCLAVMVFVGTIAPLRSADAAAPNRYVVLRSFLNELVLDRWSKDLNLSEAQLAQTMRYYKSYVDHLKPLEDELEKRMVSAVRALQFKHMPELDPKFDLSRVSDGERATIAKNRENLANGVDPVTTREYNNELNFLAVENIKTVIEAEEGSRTKFVETVVAMLSEDQMNLLPRALNRLQINIHGTSPLDRRKELGFISEPVFYLDIVGLLDEAVLNEFEPWREFLSSTEIQHSEVTQALLIFEEAYASQIRDSERNYGTLVTQQIKAYADGERARAAVVARQLAAKNAAMLSLRQALFDQLGELARMGIGDEAAQNWTMRWRRWTCPNLYKDDCIDEVTSKWLATLEDPGVVEYLTERSQRYTVEREGTRNSIFRKKIEAFTWEMSPGGGGKARDVDRLQEQYKTMMNKTYLEMRSNLPEPYQSAHDKEFETCLKMYFQ